MAQGIIMVEAGLPLLNLLRLASPALPVGAYAYSQGLESAVEFGWVRDEASLRAWLAGLLTQGLAWLDVPVLARLYRAWQDDDIRTVKDWTAQLYACREAAELRLEERQLGAALARLLAELDMAGAASWRRAEPVCFATLFALAAVRWNIPLPVAATGYLGAWCENQLAAANKLMPLGQIAGQRVLTALQPALLEAVAIGLALPDDEIAGSLPGLGLACALHETQYSRLFRS